VVFKGGSVVQFLTGVTRWEDFRLHLLIIDFQASSIHEIFEQFPHVGIFICTFWYVLAFFCCQENEKSRDIVIEQRLHRLIIGSQGSRIREIREHFPHVGIFIPDYTRKSDVITLRGPRGDVDRCFTHLQKLCHELVYQRLVSFFNLSVFLSFTGWAKKRPPKLSKLTQYQMQFFNKTI